MHSSRMRTGRSLTVLCRSLLPGGCLLPGGLSAWGVGECLLPGGSPPGGCGIPACTEADPPLWTESQTPVKTLPWPNFVVAGKNLLVQDQIHSSRMSGQVGPIYTKHQHQRCDNC